MSLRFEQDFVLDKGGNELSVASREATAQYSIDQLGSGLARPSVADLARFSMGEFLSLGLAKNESLNVRVVIGPLTGQEKAEWVGHAWATLDLRCGELGVSPGLVLFADQPDTQACRFIRVPPGQYRVDVYAYYPSYTGTAEYLTARLMGCALVPLAEWFRASHPNAKLPSWLVCHCLECEDVDPENAVFWGQRAAETTTEEWEALRDLAGRYVEFVIQLSPLPKRPSRPAPNRNKTCRWTPRLPKRCPVGLYSADLEPDLP